MNTLYHTEDFQLSKSFDDISSYLNSEALDQPLHDVEHNLFKQLLKMGKIFLDKFLKKEGAGQKVP